MGAATGRQAQSAARTCRCGERPAVAGFAGVSEHRSGYGRSPRHHAGGDRCGVVRRLRSAPGFHNFHRGEPVSRCTGSEAGISAGPQSTEPNLCSRAEQCEPGGVGTARWCIVAWWHPERRWHTARCYAGSDDRRITGRSLQWPGAAGYRDQVDRAGVAAADQSLGPVSGDDGVVQSRARCIARRGG